MIIHNHKRKRSIGYDKVTHDKKHQMKPASSNLHNKDMIVPCRFHATK
jgi:hypothetical protein